MAKDLVFETNKKFAKLTLEYKPPGQEAVASITKVREATIDLVATIMSQCSKGKDREEAIKHVRAAMMFANASIVLDGKEIS